MIQTCILSCGLWYLKQSLQERESIDDDIGLKKCLGRLKIGDNDNQKIEIKTKRSSFALPPSKQEQRKSSQRLPRNWNFIINHIQDQIIGKSLSGVKTRSSFKKNYNNSTLIS